MVEVKQDELTGFFYYEQLPENTRLATVADFVDMNNCIAISKPFLIHGFYTNTYDCFRVYPGFKIEKILPWLNEKRVYVFEKPL